MPHDHENRSNVTVVELRQLRYFVAVAEERHFGRAAARLRIATPSLSQQIRALERDLRVVVFDRRPQGATLTAAGEVLLEHARALLTRAERARDDVRCADGRAERLALRVAAGADAVLGPTLAALPARFALSIAGSPGTDAIQAVREERADAAIVWASGEPSLARIVLCQVPVELVLPAGHRLAELPAVPVADLAGETIVLFPRSLSPGVWDRTVRHLLPDSSSGQVLTEPNLLGGQQALLAAVAAGRGLATVPAPGAQHAGVVCRPLDPPLTLPLELVWRDPPRPAVTELVGYLSG